MTIAKNFQHFLALIQANTETYISFSGQRFFGEMLSVDQIKEMNDALKTNTALKTLDLSWNEIGDDGAQALADILKTNRNLKTLYLSSNEIGSAGAKSLADMLKTNTTLKTLYLSSNEIGFAGAKGLADMLKTNTVLTKLDLAENKIDDVGANALTQIDEILERNRKIEHLQKQAARNILFWYRNIKEKRIEKASVTTVDNTELVYSQMNCSTR